MQQHRVLVVEDDMATRWLLATALGEHLEVDVAESVWEAKRLIDRFGPQYCCILLDLDLPDGQGSEIVRYVRDRSDRLPVIVVTGSAAKTPGQELADTVRLVIHKPAAVHVLAASIDEYCPRRHADGLSR